jgi:hypothetical protein
MKTKAKRDSGGVARCANVLFYAQCGAEQDPGRTWADIQDVYLIT